MHRKTSEVILIALVFCTQNALCQTGDFQQTIHEQVQRYKYADPQGKEWEDTKHSLSNRTQEELAQSLIADLDVDRGSHADNRSRDGAVSRMYKALNLPLAFVCKELEKSQSPQKKASLMTMLWGSSSPEVTTALLHQLKDLRPAEALYGDVGMPASWLRVCDVACDILSHNLDPNRPGRRIGYGGTDEKRDKIIQQTLKDLKLDNPQ